VKHVMGSLTREIDLVMVHWLIGLEREGLSNQCVQCSAPCHGELKLYF
jgi:hypothetical protein